MTEEWKRRTGEVEHEPFVFVGPAGWESEEELAYFPDRATLEVFIDSLRAAANEAWRPPP